MLHELHVAAFMLLIVLIPMLPAGGRWGWWFTLMWLKLLLIKRLKTCPLSSWGCNGGIDLPFLLLFYSVVPLLSDVVKQHQKERKKPSWKSVLREISCWGRVPSMEINMRSSVGDERQFHKVFPLAETTKHRAEKWPVSTTCMQCTTWHVLFIKIVLNLCFWLCQNGGELSNKVKK